MNDRSWIFRVSPERLCKMNYCNRVDDFINYTLSNPKNISEGGIRYPFKMLLQCIFYKKSSWKKYLC